MSFKNMIPDTALKSNAKKSVTKLMPEYFKIKKSNYMSFLAWYL